VTSRKPQVLRWLAGSAAVLAPLAPAQAILEFVPYVSAAVEHDSNVRRNNEDLGEDDDSDLLQTYRAGLDAAYTAGLQKLSLSGSVYTAEYDELSEYDYEGHDLLGRLNWQIGSLVKGDLSGGTTRSIESFAARLGDDEGRSLVDTDTAALSAAIKVLRDFELRPRVSTRRARYEADISRQQNLDEDTGALALAYVGLGSLQIGIEGEIADGEYVARDPGVGVIEEYEQSTARLIASWQPSVITSLSATLGATRRDNQGVDVGNSNDVVGSLNLTRNISAKTSAYAGLYRTVTSPTYQGESTVVSTGLSLGTTWKAATTVDVRGAYVVQRDDFQDSLLAGGEDRRDDLQSVSLELDYRPRNWISLGPSFAWQDRASDVDTEDYDAYQVTLRLTLRWPYPSGGVAPAVAPP
jgi:hypothetical protein